MRFAHDIWRKSAWHTYVRSYAKASRCISPSLWGVHKTSPISICQLLSTLRPYAVIDGQLHGIFSSILQAHPTLMHGAPKIGSSSSDYDLIPCCDVVLRCSNFETVVMECPADLMYVTWSLYSLYHVSRLARCEEFLSCSSRSFRRKEASLAWNQPQRWCSSWVSALY